MRRRSASLVYFDPAVEPEPPFRRGEAGLVWVNAGGEIQHDVRVALSPNTLHALHGHGVITRLRALPLGFGSLEPGRDSLISPAGAEAAMRIFYEADRMTYGGEHDLLVAEQSHPRRVQYRLRVDNREYQRSLSQLQFLCRQALTLGAGIRLRP